MKIIVKAKERKYTKARKHLEKSIGIKINSEIG